MKKRFYLLLFLFTVAKVYANETLYITDAITINSLEYNKTKIKILKPCILNKNKLPDPKEENIDSLLDKEKLYEEDEVLDTVKNGEAKIGNSSSVYKSTNTIKEEDLYSYYDDSNDVLRAIYDKLLSNLLKTNLYEVDYDGASCENINEFFIENGTKDISEYILSDELIDNSYVMSAEVEYLNNNDIKLQVFLWDTLEQKFLSGKYYVIGAKNIINRDAYNKAADMISDFVFQTTTGETGGLFDSKIIYISETGDIRNRKKQVNIMNFDGSKNMTITHGNNLKLTPIFSKYNPDEVFYLEYTKDGAFIVRHNLKTGHMTKITTKDQEMTSAASFNPAGKNQIIIAGSEENKGTNLILFDLDKKTNRKITNDKNAINTAASFSPNGDKIVYVSDKVGGRKLFIKDLETDEEEMISKDKGLYDKPAWSPDGRLIAFVKILGGQFYLGVMTTTGDGERYLASDYLIEGVKWSPNSRYLIYTKQKGPFGKDSVPKIYVMDVLTKNEYQLNTPDGEGASDPDWVINK